MFQEYLKRIIERGDLSEDQMAEAMDLIFSGQSSDAQIGALMAALATKGETYAELAGAARAMRKKALRLQVPVPTLVDIVGTGGDGAHTFNISTTTAFVVAGCGVPVAKHGNRAVSSRCGSADVLEALGVNLNLDPERVEEAVMEIGIGFLYAPLYHKAMRHAARARKEIGLRSIFNMLGPLTNPAAANCILLGVYAAGLTEMFAQALKRLGARRALVVHGHDGLDEITVCGPTRVSELKDGAIRTYDLFPETYFGGVFDPEDLKGGDVSENAAITRGILGGDSGPKRDIILFNAGAALLCAGKANDLAQGIEMARQAIDSGAARAKLEALVAFTNEDA
jgi:anthranilate phosphoribosyltransferase